MRMPVYHALIKSLKQQDWTSFVDNCFAEEMLFYRQFRTRQPFKNERVVALAGGDLLVDTPLATDFGIYIRAKLRALSRHFNKHLLVQSGDLRSRDVYAKLSPNGTIVKANIKTLEVEGRQYSNYDDTGNFILRDCASVRVDVSPIRFADFKVTWLPETSFCGFRVEFNIVRGD